VAPRHLLRVLLKRVLRIVDYQVGAGKKLDMTLVFAMDCSRVFGPAGGGGRR